MFRYPAAIQSKRIADFRIIVIRVIFHSTNEGEMYKIPITYKIKIRKQCSDGLAL